MSKSTVSIENVVFSKESYKINIASCFRTIYKKL